MTVCTLLSLMQMFDYELATYLLVLAVAVELLE